MSWKGYEQPPACRACGIRARDLDANGICPSATRCEAVTCERHLLHADFIAPVVDALGFKERLTLEQQLERRCAEVLERRAAAAPKPPTAEELAQWGKA